MSETRRKHPRLRFNYTVAPLVPTPTAPSYQAPAWLWRDLLIAFPDLSQFALAAQQAARNRPGWNWPKWIVHFGGFAQAVPDPSARTAALDHLRELWLAALR